MFSEDNTFSVGSTGMVSLSVYVCVYVGMFVSVCMCMHDNIVFLLTAASSRLPRGAWNGVIPLPWLINC